MNIPFRALAATLSLSSISLAHAADEYFKAYTVTTHPQVRVIADDASVKISTSEDSKVEFHARQEGVEWGLAIGEQPKIESTQNGNVVELRLRAAHRVSIGVNTKRTRVEVRMPRDADLEIETGDGSVELASVNGTITVRTGDGGIRAAQLTGKIELSSGDGSITGDELQGQVRLRTGDGRIRGQRLSGRCEAASRDGSIQVQGRFEELNLRSGDGSISAEVEQGSQISSRWALATQDGSVRLALPRDFKANVDASTGDGHIRSELPLQMQGEVSHRRLQGTLNGGGPFVQIRTGDGSIELAGI